MLDIETLDLTESYQFNVTVEVGQNKFAAKLELSPEKITFTIMGEEDNERNCALGWENVDRLICSKTNQTFILHDLQFVKGESRVINFHPNMIGFFENTYEVGYLIFSPTIIYEDNKFSSISIHSTTIEKWIGNTHKQEEILKAYHNKEPIMDNPDKLNEFHIELDNIGLLGVSYHLSIHSSSPDFSSGINFPPSLIIGFNNLLTSKEIKIKFDKVYSLLSFFIGNDFVVNRVDVGCNTGTFGSSNGSLYYPSKDTHPKDEQRYVFFPLGMNIRFDSLGLPPLPLDTFNSYFSLSTEQIGYFSKYLKYKRMNNTEEKFLGFFRILETLTFKKKSYLDEKLLSELSIKAKPYLIKKFGDNKSVTSFLRGLLRYNNSKYNTDKCIQDLYKKLPKSLTDKWKFARSDIANICNLRNDITHANDYYADEREVQEKTKFVEVLLIHSLCEILGVSFSILESLSYRIEGYHLITK